ncbi:MAG: AMP-dependent synthetase/ligase [Spirochaetota bacterium]
MIVEDYHYPLHSIPNRRDFRDMLDRTCENFGEQLTFFEKDERDRYQGITYNQFRHRIACLGEALLDMGIVQRDKIAIMGKNCRKWAISYYAVVSSNCIIVPIDKDLGGDEIERIVTKAEVKAAIFENRYTEIFQAVSRKHRFLKYLIPFDAQKNYPVCLDVLIQNGEQRIKQGNRKYPGIRINPEETASILFTSGTTGTPKGVMLSQKNIISNIVQMRQLIWLDETMTFLSVLPLHHVYECTCGFLCQVHAGTRIAYAQSLKKIAQNINEIRPTNINVVPLLLEAFYRRIIEKINEKPSTRIKFKIGDLLCSMVQAVLRKNIRRKVFNQVHDRFGGKLDLFITGGAAVKPEISRFLRKLGFRVIQGYGITECSPFLAGNRDRFFSDSAAGLPSPGCDIEIFDKNDTGIGEIGAKGPNVMLGYYREPELTKQAFRSGYFMTGDLGYIDSKNFLYVVGRKKHTIVTKTGKNIYPEEIEFQFLHSELIKEIVISERRDPETMDEIIAAHIHPNLEVLAERTGKQEDEIADKETIPLIRKNIREVNAKLVSYKRITYFYLHREEFEKTTTRKIKRFLVEPEGEPIPVYR